MTSLSTAQSIVAAADAWLLKNLNDHEAIFSHTVNGRTTQVQGYDAVLKVRDRFLAVVRAKSKRRRTFARFDA